MEKFLMSAKEAAEAADVSTLTIYQWMKEPGFPVIRRGRCSRIPVELFKDWLNKKATTND